MRLSSCDRRTDDHDWRASPSWRTTDAVIQLAISTKVHADIVGPVGGFHNCVSTLAQCFAF